MSSSTLTTGTLPITQQPADITNQQATMCEKTDDELPGMQAITSIAKIDNELDYATPDGNQQSTRPSNTPDSLRNASHHGIRHADDLLEFKLTQSMDDELVIHSLDSPDFGNPYTFTHGLQRLGDSLTDPDYFERLYDLAKDDDDMRGDGVCRE